MSHSEENVGMIGENLTSNCAEVTSWMERNKLKLNAGKTHILTVGTSTRVNNLTSPVEVVMDSTTLQESQERCESLLGVQIEY